MKTFVHVHALVKIQQGAFGRVAELNYFMTVIISELEKGNGELYMPHENLDITMVYLRFSYIMLYTVTFLQKDGKIMKESRKD